MGKNKNHSFDKSKLPSPSKGVITDKEAPDASIPFEKNNKSDKKTSM